MSFPTMRTGALSWSREWDGDPRLGDHLWFMLKIRENWQTGLGLLFFPKIMLLAGSRGGSLDLACL